jgi:3-dehydroquinate synthase
MRGMPMKIKVDFGNRDISYNIEIKSYLLDSIGKILQKKRNYSKIVILTNEIVFPLWYKKLNLSLSNAGHKIEVIVIPDGEKQKCIKTYNQIISQMLKDKIDRYSALIPLGGGVIGDLGGYIASTYMRGIDLIHVPTTLVAQIDSSIGGKLAIDHPQAKNIIGNFYNPAQVFTDPNILSTLNDREFRCGLFEAIKIALVSSQKLYAFITENFDSILNRKKRIIQKLVTDCVQEKVMIVKQDPFDQNRRMILNFGHTFGHALETASNYRKISHGEAVGWGMLLALHISDILKIFDLQKNRNMYVLIRNMLNIRDLKKLDPEQIWKTILLDKKARDGNARFILLKKAGKPVMQVVSKRTFMKAVSRI